jgi:hypothetical protein
MNAWSAHRSRKSVAQTTNKSHDPMASETEYLPQNSEVCAVSLWFSEVPIVPTCQKYMPPVGIKLELHGSVNTFIRATFIFAFASLSVSCGRSGLPYETCLALPSCEGNDKSVPFCANDGTRCYERSVCGNTILCAVTELVKVPVQCQAIPTCDSGDALVSGCQPNDTRCYARSMCGTTIRCLKAEPRCTTVPSCDTGDTQVSGQSSCVQDDARCYERNSCGYSIWCSGPQMNQCDAVPTCPANEQELPQASCANDSSCHPVTLCGQTIWCRPDSANCAGYPSCDTGDIESTQQRCLLTDVSCYQRVVCGYAIWCIDQ